jgi:UDP-N-acetylmuramoyl-L-alanyl-D-glutamate--2,6-diaminopimelate ligase
MQLAHLIEGLQTKNIQGSIHREIKDLSFNSKEVGTDCLFVALRGTRVNVHDFIPEALASGAQALIVEEETRTGNDITVITVPDTHIALAHVADCFYQHPSQKLTVIGITGTNGKTTISYLVESILKEAGCNPGVIGTIDYRFGSHHRDAPNTTPNALDLQKIMKEMVDDKTSHLIIEVSSHSLDQHRVDKLNFDVAVFTNLSPEHLDYHHTLEQYAEAKKLLFTYYLDQSIKDKTHAIINCTDPLGTSLIKATKAQVLCYGLTGEAEIRAEQVSLTREGLSMRVTTPQGEIEIHSSLIGAFNSENILAAVGIALTQGISPETIRKGIAQVEYIPGRLERVPNPMELTILIDYAHTSDALDHVLTALRSLCTGRLITVFGCGGDRDKTKRAPMGDTATRKSDLAIITSDNPRTEDPLDIIEQIKEGIDQTSSTYYALNGLKEAGPGRGYTVIPQRRAAIRTAVRLTKPGDILLIAGKGHEDYQIIGTTRHHFSDREEIIEALTGLPHEIEALPQ